MNGQNAPENTDVFVLAERHFSVDKTITEALKIGELEKLKMGNPTKKIIACVKVSG